jgi:hypothetical protein
VIFTHWDFGHRERNRIMIPEDIAVDVARAIERALYPDAKKVTGEAFVNDAKSFVAALNAVDAAKDRGAPDEFKFDTAVLSGGAPGVPAKATLSFKEQPKDGDGFSIGRSRYEFVTSPIDIVGTIVIGPALSSTIGVAVSVINGPVPVRGDPVVTAVAGENDTIVVTAKEMGVPLVPVQTVTWSRLMTAEEKAQAERDERDEKLVPAKSADASKSPPSSAQSSAPQFFPAPSASPSPTVAVPPPPLPNPAPPPAPSPIAPPKVPA